MAARVKPYFLSQAHMAKPLGKISDQLKVCSAVLRHPERRRELLVWRK
jgi:hypothetical protein